MPGVAIQPDALRMNGLRVELTPEAPAAVALMDGRRMQEGALVASLRRLGMVMRRPDDTQALRPGPPR